MAWTSADQNPSLSPSAAYGNPGYAAQLNAVAYDPLSGGSSSTGMAPAASGGSSYANRLNASAAPAATAAPQPTRRALESSTGIQPAKGSQGAREIQPWGGGGTRFEIAGNAAAPGRAGKANEALVDIMRKAAEGSPFNVQMFSGYRPGDKRQHGRANAVDIALVDPYSGEPLANYQSPETFPQYEAFARRAYEIAQRDYPDLAGNFRWGGYFAGKNAPRWQGGKYGATDLMHFDVNSGMGMAGGSFEKGLTADQRRLVERSNNARTTWAGARPGMTTAPPTMYAGDPFGVSGAKGNTVMAGGDVPPPRMRPNRTEMAYAPSPETMDAAPFDAVIGASRDRRPQPPTPPANPRRDRLQQPAAAQPAGGGAYVVRRGDNLTRIGQQFGVSPMEIARANGLSNPDLIQPGQQLVIPGGQAPAPQRQAPQRQAPSMPQPRMRPSREVAMPTPPPRPERGANVPDPRMRPQPRPSMSSEQDIQSSVARFRDGLPPGPRTDEAVLVYEQSLRQQAGIPAPRPAMGPADIGRSVANHRAYLLSQGIQPGPMLDEAVLNYERRLREEVARGGAQPPISQAEPSGANMDTAGLIRGPTADERGLQRGARFQLPTVGQPIDPRNAAQMDRADGVYSPIAVPGGPPWVASNGIRFFAVR